jgi:uncharacterized membrane protein
MSETDTTIGPVQLIAIGFEPGFKFTGKIMHQMEKLEESKTIRILDLLFVKKDDDGAGLTALDWQGEDMGAIVGALMGFEFEGSDKAKEQTDKAAERNKFGIKMEEIEKLGEALDPGSAAGILLIEHLWARDLKKLIRDANGFPIAEGFLSPEAIAAVSKELIAVSQEIDQIEEEDSQQKTIIT